MHKVLIKSTFPIYTQYEIYNFKYSILLQPVYDALNYCRAFNIFLIKTRRPALHTSKGYKCYI